MKKKLGGREGAKDAHEEPLYSSTLRYEVHVTLKTFRFGRVWMKIVSRGKESFFFFFGRWEKLTVS